MATQPPPGTLDEAVDRLLQVLPAEELNAISARPEEDVRHRHFSLGLGIRNNFGLWNRDSPLLRDCAARSEPGAVWIHPDEASMMIMRALWVRLRQ